MLEDSRVIRNDAALRELLGIKKMPSSEAVCDRLRRKGKGDGLSGLEKVRRLAVRRIRRILSTGARRHRCSMQ